MAGTDKFGFVILGIGLSATPLYCKIRVNKMISENTVLILGAGASKPYGYPTALELREDIITKFIPKLREVITNSEPNSDFDNHPFVRRLSKMINHFKESSTESIDLFLTRNKDYVDEGKQIITFLLGSNELESKFREDMDMKERKFDWYFKLYNILTREISKPEDLYNFSNNKISIITFNYDRSLEHFLFESLSNSFLNMNNDVINIMRDFKIIHVYGKLAPLFWESGCGVKYRQTYIRDYYIEYSKNIQIIYDERKSKIEEIKQIISEAKKIFLLGFGFAEENIEAIGLNQNILNNKQNIFATGLGLTEKERNKNIELIRTTNQNIGPHRFSFEDCDSLMLLRNYL